MVARALNGKQAATVSPTVPSKVWNQLFGELEDALAELNEANAEYAIALDRQSQAYDAKRNAEQAWKDAESEIKFDVMFGGDEVFEKKCKNAEMRGIYLDNVLRKARDDGGSHGAARKAYQDAQENLSRAVNDAESAKRAAYAAQQRVDAYTSAIRGVQA